MKVHSLAFSNEVRLFTLKTFKLMRPVFMVKMLYLILTINIGPISLKVFNVNNRIPLEKANECTLISTIPSWPDDGRVTAETCSGM